MNVQCTAKRLHRPPNTGRLSILGYMLQQQVFLKERVWIVFDWTNKWHTGTMMALEIKAMAVL